MENCFKIAVIGVGIMGSKYALQLQEGRIEGACLAALTRVKSPYREQLLPSIESGVPVYPDGAALLSAVERGELALDGVIIATPHFDHQAQAVHAFRAGLAVLTDKPLGVHLGQGLAMIAAARESGKPFGAVFQQRTNPLYQQIREIIQSKKYGELKRVNWVVTDWYRPDSYYTSAPWRATWATDGGGVLLNQCPHNLDLLQWMCGMPTRVQAFCHAGRFHPIEVEDDVTAYMEWENGANGTFITSTGDAPGVNRLEISLEEAMLVCENGTLKIGELAPQLGMSEGEFRRTTQEYFPKLSGSWTTYQPQPCPDPYRVMLENFRDAALTGAALIAPGEEGKQSLTLSNAMYLSSWEGRMVTLPTTPEEEQDFARQVESHLRRLSGK